MRKYISIITLLITILIAANACSNKVKSNELSQDTVQSHDSLTVQTDKICHQDNDPIQVPAHEKGYQCLQTFYIPGAPLSKSADVNGNMFPSNSEQVLKAWVCMDDTCQCGKGVCPKNGICVNEKCFCGAFEIKPDDNYNCNISDEVMLPDETGQFIEYIFMTSQCQSDSCSCGNDTCSHFSECVNNTCECGGRKKPSRDFVCIGSEKPSKAGNVWRCVLNDGCQVSGVQVPKGAIFHGGTIACGSLIDEMPGKDYICEEYIKNSLEYAWICTNETECLCGVDKCRKGQACIEGACLNPRG